MQRLKGSWNSELPATCATSSSFTSQAAILRFDSSVFIASPNGEQSNLLQGNSGNDLLDENWLEGIPFKGVVFDSSRDLLWH